MIPRLKPYLDKNELLAAGRPDQMAVEHFEAEFARVFEAKYALAFPYGRSALWSFFKAMEIHDAEIIMPAYTCSVVAHAIVLSGNIPHFVDISLHDYNMDLDQVKAAINEHTRAIVATHLFGYPLNVDQLKQIVHEAEAYYGNKIWIIQDCAHSFGAYWQGKLVCNEGDIALYGLNISKMITSIFGGMLTANDADLMEKIRSWRNANFNTPGFLKALRRYFYLLAVYPAFQEQLYGIVQWLQEDTPFLDRLTKAYHLDEKIHFPPDFMDNMLSVEARIGLIQLDKYAYIVKKRQDNAAYYSEHLQNLPGLILPPIVNGASYSHYVIRVPDRHKWMYALKEKGIQLGQLIEYSVPHMKAYTTYTLGQEFPNSFLCSQHTINLPVHAALREQDRMKIISSMSSVAENLKE